MRDSDRRNARRTSHQRAYVIRAAADLDPREDLRDSFKPVSGAGEIQQLLMDAGPGARGIVFGSRGADPGHVFNAVNQRGVVRFLDGQSGGPASFGGFDAFHFLRTNL